MGVPMANNPVTNNPVAVDQAYYWQPMATCPCGTKVQLLGAGGLATHGQYDGKNPFWLGWTPLPNKPDWMKK